MRRISLSDTGPGFRRKWDREEAEVTAEIATTKIGVDHDREIDTKEIDIVLVAEKGIAIAHEAEVVNEIMITFDIEALKGISISKTVNIRIKTEIIKTKIEIIKIEIENIKIAITKTKIAIAIRRKGINDVPPQCKFTVITESKFGEN